MTTGNLCTRYAIEVLFRYGKEDIAWHLLTQTEYPSWGYMLKNGATTVWERWEKIEDNDFLDAMATMNHPMNGGACVSLPRYLAGITPDEKKPGYEHFFIRPILPSKAGKLSFALDTMRGKIRVAWEKTQEMITFHIEVPQGTSASVVLPGEEDSRELAGGSYELSVKI